ncbi:MAG: hypothetical protein U0586_11185 [Candidatus Brocadiaceae bacterium]
MENIWQDKNAPWVAMLIPSYKEELGSFASLFYPVPCKYPHRRVALLIGNPPDPVKFSVSPEDIVMLEEFQENFLRLSLWIIYRT